MTTTTKHTPGPWVVKHSGTGDATVTASNGWVNKDGSLFEPTIVPRIDFPTAHLIAAAPAMYEALHVLCREIQGAVSIENGIVSFPDGGYLDINPILAQAEGK